MTILHTNAEGMVNSALTTGVDYDENPFKEEFTLTGDSAVWSINSDRKTAKFSNQAYLPSKGGPAVFELPLKWLLKQPGRKASTLPDGAMHAEAPTAKILYHHGKRMQLLLFPVYFDPSPTPGYIWMTGGMQFFASGNVWNTVIQKGYEDLVGSLLAMQETASQSYYLRQLNTNSRPLAKHMYFTHANVFQSATARVQKDMTVEIKDGKIAAIFPSPSSAPKEGAVIDCAGKFIMPGLWDMHAHYDKEEGAVYLGGGVTHIRDMGNTREILTF